MIRRVSMALAMAGLLGLTASSAHAGLTNLLTDGSFEAATLNPNPGANVNNANAIGTTSGTLLGSSSWTVTDTLASGTKRGVMIASTGNSTANTYFSATLPADPLTAGVATELAGTQVAYFIGDTEIVSLGQSLSVVAGQTYTFGFDAATTWTSRNNANTSSLVATLGSATLSTTSASLPTPTSATSDNSWTHFSGSFTATTTGTENFLSTYTGGAAAAQDILIDRVFVTTAVPEPGTMALGAIVCGIGGMAYRRTRARQNTAV